MRTALLLLLPLLLVTAHCGGSSPSPDGGTMTDRDLAAPLYDLAHEKECGGQDNLMCPAGMYCETTPAGECCCNNKGICKLPPPSCPTKSDPVCGCDGLDYDNDCLRQKAGVSASMPGTC